MLESDICLVFPVKPIKVVVFDIDDTLWHAIDFDDGMARDRFDVIDGRRVADHPGHAQELVENAREVLEILSKKGYVVAIATMGPQDQVRSFMEGFGITKHFDFEISAFERVDKAEKIAHILDRANELGMGVAPSELLFVDDNMGYLKAVNERFPEVKCVWAHYFMPPGLLALNEDVEEMHGFSLW